MSTTNKGFNYIFNTSKEDHMVSKILNGHDTSTNVAIQDLRWFDSQTRSTISSFQQHLFSTCHDLQAAQHNVNQAVLDVLTSTVIRHYPLLKRPNAESPVIKRFEACTTEAGCSLVELLAWSAHLANPELPCEDCKSSSAHQTYEQSLTQNTEQMVIDHQGDVINNFIEHVKLQDARMDALEAKMNGPTQGTHKRQKSETSQYDSSLEEAAQISSDSPSFDLPPLWRAPVSKQQKSDAKQLVAYMKLFLDDGFTLDTTKASYRDQVLSLGIRAEKSVLMFLEEHNISSRGSGAVLKHLHSLHRAGALNTKIERHEQLLQTPAIQDPAPNILEQTK
ncbi:LOW QUALITY PROTEIN: Hypothetical protein PHPALM_14831 [Phytophthora palmivora]|uniref:Uncharacterized protein n=1 Tax=Phytophthora palmivora TaxID=4796 RepID=A0A2P4XTS6_9STRA|nr:LOW QUALITY PROTEIN: Hypothetical protein PHPALM_14831 [Phytophthora palmivora]